MGGGNHMNNKDYGYIRLSSKGQNEMLQQIAMREAGVDDDRIFMDKQMSLSKPFSTGQSNLTKKVYNNWQ